MLHKTRGIVFKAIKFSETSVIAHIYTEKFGLQSYMLNGIRSSKSKTKMSLLQPLGLLDMVVYHKEYKNIQRVNEIKAAYIFRSLPFDITKSSIILLLNEVLHKCIKEQEANQELFHYIFDHIIFLDGQENHFANFHLSFLAHLSKYLGFAPAGKFGNTTPFFDLQEGKFCAEAPAHSYFLEEPLSRYFYEIHMAGLNSSGATGWNRVQRNLLLNKLLLYYALHMENFKHLASPKILEAIFD